MSHTDLHRFHGHVPPISQAHYMSHTDRIRKATEEEKKSNLFAAAAHWRKDTVPDEILNVTVTCDVTGQK